jgi:hypothetical protein
MFQPFVQYSVPLSTNEQADAPVTRLAARFLSTERLEPVDSLALGSMGLSELVFIAFVKRVDNNKASSLRLEGELYKFAEKGGRPDLLLVCPDAALVNQVDKDFVLKQRL